MNLASFKTIYSSLAIRSSEKGVSLYLAILIMGILLATSLGLTTLSLLQIQTIKGMGDSVSAFYAADTGIEKILYDKKQGIEITVCTKISPCVGNLNGARQYNVIMLAPGEEGCSGLNYCLESVGFYQDTRRAIRLTR